MIYLAAAIIAAAELAVLAASLRPHVSAQYRAYFITRQAQHWRY